MYFTYPSHCPVTGSFPVPRQGNPLPYREADMVHRRLGQIMNGESRSRETRKWIIECWRRRWWTLVVWCQPLLLGHTGHCTLTQPLSSAKIRTSRGETKNRMIPSFLYFTRCNKCNKAHWSCKPWVIYSTEGSQWRRPANPSLNWETFSFLIFWSS